MMRMRGGIDVETGSLVLIADEAALRRFTRLLRRHAPLVIELDPVLERPALRPVAVLSIEPVAHQAIIRVAGKTATLAGDLLSYERLADEIELFLEYNDLTEPGMHMHVDASDVRADARILSSESVDLLVAGPVPDAEL